MEIFTHMLTTVVIAVSSFFGLQQLEPAPSVELGLVQEISPRGEEGGFAMPASGCSYDYTNPSETHGHAVPDCSGYPTIDLDPPIVRSEEDVEVFWDVGPHENCVLTYLDQAVGVATSGSIPNIVLTAETVFTVTCDDGSATAVGKVLPKIQET